MSISERIATEGRPAWITAGLASVSFVALLWFLELADQVSNNRLDQLGIRPRSEEGLLGILFAPLLHGGWGHLESNTIPVLLLGFLVLASGVGRGLAATAVIWLVAGVGVWLIAPANSITLGASVLVFGWLLYLVVRGFVTRNPWEIIVGITLLIMYGGVLFGVLPGQPGISWQGHLFGAIGGVLAALWLCRRRRASRRRPTLLGPTPFS